VASKVHTITCYEGTGGGVQVHFYPFFTFGARWCSWLTARQAALPQRTRSSTNYIHVASNSTRYIHVASNSI